MSMFVAKNKKPDLIKRKYQRILIAGLIGWIVYLFGSIIDNIFSGKFLSIEALNAVQIVTPFYSFINFIACLINISFAVRYNHVLGKEGKEKASKIAGLGLIFTIAISVILSLLYFFLQTPLLKIFSSSERTFELANNYFLWQIVIAAIYPIYSYIYRLVDVDGDASCLITTDITQVFVKILTSFFFMRAFGISGLGMGTVSAIVAALVITLTHWFKKRSGVRFKFYFSIKEIGSCLKNGIAASSRILYITIAMALLNVYIVTYIDNSFLPTYSIINFIVNIADLFICIPNCAANFLSIGHGSKNYDDIKKCIKLEKKWAIIVSVVCTILFASLSPVIPFLYGVYNNSSQYWYSCIAVLIIVPSYIFSAFLELIVNTNVSIAINRETSIIIPLFNKLIFYTFLPVILGYLAGQLGFIAGFMLAPICTLILVLIILFIKHKKPVIFKLKEIDEKQFSFDYFAKDDSIKAMIEEVRTILKENKVDRTALIKTIGSISDINAIIIKYNPNNLITVRLTLGIAAKIIRIIVKHDGRILTNEEKIKIENSKDDHFFFTACINAMSYKTYTAVSYSYSTLTIDRA